MKKLIALGVLIFIMGTFVFAEDAMVMPRMVGRIYTAPTFSFAPGEFDTGNFIWNADSFSSAAMALNLGFALEFGVLSWVTAAVQWGPGWTPWSDIKGAAPPAFSAYGGELNANGVADIFVGAKVQIVGQHAPIQNSMFRAAIAPGVIVPLRGPDFSKEIPKVLTGKKATINSMDRHVFAFGGRVFFDWIINENFFLNIYNETIVYPFKQDLDKHSAAFPGAKFMMASGLPAIMDTKGTVNYKLRTTFEIEGVFTTSLVPGIRLNAGLPVNYRFIPAPEYAFDFPNSVPGPLQPTFTAGFLSLLGTDPVHIVTLRPNASVFFTNTPVPLEFKLSYALPVWGMNTQARHEITLQARVYFALPGAF